MLWGGETNPPQPEAEKPQSVRATLRHYQVEALDAVWEQHGDGRKRTFVVMATGTGKTQVFCTLAYEAIERFKKPVLIITDRCELIEQASDRFLQMFGIRTEWEKADQYASLNCNVVVCTIQTIQKQKRLDRFPPDHFGLVVVDECHKFITKSGKKVIHYFQADLTVGFTATPNEDEERSLSKVFGDTRGASPAFVYDILQALEDGWLVEPEAYTCKVDAYDVSGVTSRNGDLAQGELDDVVCAAAYGVVDQIVNRTSESDKIVAFFPGVKSAELAQEIFDTKLPGVSGSVSGKTPKDERQALVRALKGGQKRALFNCEVAVEGFDWPSANVCAMARATGSRRIYVQAVGRVLRPDCYLGDLLGKDQAAERKARIAASKKPKAMVYDFCGNAGKHTLQNTVDLFAASFSEDEVSLARTLAADAIKERESDRKKELERAQKTGDEPKEFGPSLQGLEALKEARRRLKEQAEALRLHTTAELRRFDPFELCDTTWEEENRYGRYTEPATKAQRGALAKFGVTEYELNGMSKSAASRLLDGLIERKNRNLPSLKAVAFLTKLGFDIGGVTGQAAKDTCAYIISRMKTRQRWDRKTAEEILHDSQRTSKASAP